MTKPDDALQMLKGAREERSVATLDFEMRAKKGSNNLYRFTGYAAMFNSQAQVNSGPLGPFKESLHPTAFDVTLDAKPDFVLRTEHRNLPIARTTAGNLFPSVDSMGLLVEADLDRRDQDVQQLAIKLENGNLNQMSYVFRAVRDRWNEDYTARELLEVNLDKGDVSIVTYGANENTSARMTSLVDMAEALRCADFGSMLVEARSLNDPMDALREMRSTLDHLLREVAPSEKRTMSLAEAEALISGR